MSRYARAVDANQSEVVAALLAVGVLVESIASLGKGVPDLMCGYRSRIVLLEVKDGRKPPSQRKLTDDELKFHARWQGFPVYVVHCVEDALTAVGVVMALHPSRKPLWWQHEFKGAFGSPDDLICQCGLSKREHVDGPGAEE